MGGKRGEGKGMGEGRREEEEDRGRGGGTRYARRSAAVIGTPGKKDAKHRVSCNQLLITEYFF